MQISLLVAGVELNEEVIVPINIVGYVNTTFLFMDCDNYFNIDIGKTIEFIKNEIFFEYKFNSKN